MCVILCIYLFIFILLLNHFYFFYLRVEGETGTFIVCLFVYLNNLVLPINIHFTDNTALIRQLMTLSFHGISSLNMLLEINHLRSKFTSILFLRLTVKCNNIYCKLAAIFCQFSILKNLLYITKQMSRKYQGGYLSITRLAAHCDLWPDT